MIGLAIKITGSLLIAAGGILTGLKIRKEYKQRRWLDHGFLRIAEQVVEYDERSGETALPLLRVVGFVVNVDLHHAGTCFTSLMTQTTSGIEPVFMPVYKRRRKVNPNDPCLLYTSWTCCALPYIKKLGRERSLCIVS